MGFTTEQTEILTLLDLIVNVISFSGSFFICVIYIRYIELRTFAFKLIFYLSIADIFVAIGSVIPSTGVS
jgi:hypothetical protein